MNMQSMDVHFLHLPKSPDDTTFITSQDLHQLFEVTKKEEGFDCLGILGLDSSAPFLAEIVYLNGWNREINDSPQPNNLYEYSVDISLEDTPAAEGKPASSGSVQCSVVIHVHYSDIDNDEHIAIALTPDSEKSGQYALEIIRNDNLIYCRTADQDPATEWILNIMAEDPLYTDENGEIAFHGDHTNI